MLGEENARVATPRPQTNSKKSRSNFMDFAVLESAEFWTKERSSAAFLQAGFNKTLLYQERSVRSTLSSILSTLPASCPHGFSGGRPSPGAAASRARAVSGKSSALEVAEL